MKNLGLGIMDFIGVKMEGKKLRMRKRLLDKFWEKRSIWGV